MSSPSQQAAWQRSQSNLQSSASYAITVYKRQNDLDSRITNAITSARDARAKAERIRQRSPERQFTSTSRDACDPYGFYPVASAASQYEERHRYPRSSNSPEQVSQTFREQLLYAQGCLSDAQALKDLRSHLDTVNGQFAIHSGRILTAMGHSNIHEDPASIVTTWLSIPDTSNPRREVALYFPNNSVQVTPQATPQNSRPHSQRVSLHPVVTTFQMNWTGHDWIAGSVNVYRSSPQQVQQDGRTWHKTY